MTLLQLLTQHRSKIHKNSGKTRPGEKRLLLLPGQPALEQGQFPAVTLRPGHGHFSARGSDLLELSSVESVTGVLFGNTQHPSFPLLSRTTLPKARHPSWKRGG